MTDIVATRQPKIPESVLVVIHTAELEVLLIERADHPGYWQSVTGSKDTPDEPLATTARREVFEDRRAGDYDHLARYGEWQMTDRANPESVGGDDA